MKKKDLIVAIVVLALAGLLALVFHFAGGEPMGSVNIKVDGKSVGVYSLAEPQEIPVDTDYGHNLVVIENGKAHMEEADCPDHYCEEQGSISKSGETIVCLPHKLVVETVNAEENDVDVVAQ